MEWGTPVQWGLFLLFSRSGGHKTKETYPNRPGSPTPCKQGITCFVKGKQTLKMEKTFYKLHIFRQGQFVVFFHLNVSLYGRLFNESFSLFYLRSIFTAFAVGLSSQNKAKLSLASIFGNCKVNLCHLTMFFSLLVFNCSVVVQQINIFTLF